MHDGVVPRRPSSRAGCYGLVLLAARPGAVGGGPAHTDTAPPTTRLALGVISAPGREALRADARSTWAHASVVPRDVSVRFVLPARELADEALLREAEAHADVLFTNCTDAAPTAAWRKQWLWLEHAARAYGAARWVGKLEDDVFADLAGTRGFLGLPFLNASRPTIVGAWEHFSWLERAGCPVGHGFSLSVAAQAHRQHCAARALRRANESCFGPFVFPKASGVFLSAPALRALLASRARRLAHARSPPACPASAARARPVGARFRGVLSEDVWLGYALRKHVAQRSLVLFSLQLSLLGDNAASKGATSAVSLLLHDQRKTALKLPKKAPRAPPAGGPVLEGAQQEDGGGFSRVRRAHVLRMREPFNASAYRYEVQERLIGPAAPGLALTPHAAAVLVGARVQSAGLAPTYAMWPRAWAMYTVHHAERRSDGAVPVLLPTKEPIDAGGVPTRYPFERVGRSGRGWFNSWSSS